MTNKILIGGTPTIPDESIAWSRWTLGINEQDCSFKDANERWDYNATLKFISSVEIKSSGIPSQLKDRDIRLLTTVSCASTLQEFSHEAVLANKGSYYFASAALHIPGNLLSQELSLKQWLTSELVVMQSFPEIKMETIVASRKPETLELSENMTGFPVVAYSFSEKFRPSGPWFLDIFATAPDDPFSSSVRLHMNTDSPLAKKLLDGTATADQKQVFEADIARTLIYSVVALSRNIDLSLQELLEEAPTSIAAAANISSRLWSGMQIDDAVRMVQHKPWDFEFRFKSYSKVLEA